MVLRAIDPGNLPRMADVRIDAAVLAFTLAVSGLTAIAFGIVPALRTRRVRISTARCARARRSRRRRCSSGCATPS